MPAVQCYPKNKIINGRYQIIKPLGEGAMSSVYLVRDLRLRGAEWALKELKLSVIPADEVDDAIKLFAREGEILGRLNHPGLPQLIDFNSDGAQNNYIVMERVQGKTLDEVLGGRVLPLRSEEAVPIALQVAHVIDYLHRQQPPIIFRDLKPSNLMLTESGRVCFIDFGIARFYKAGYPGTGNSRFLCSRTVPRAFKPAQRYLFAGSYTVLSVDIERSSIFQFQFSPVVNIKFPNTSPTRSYIGTMPANRSGETIQFRPRIKPGFRNYSR